MESILNALIKIIGFFFKRKPVILTIDSFCDTWISLHNISGDSFIVLKIEPYSHLSRFPIDHFVKPETYFRINSISTFVKFKTKKIRIRIKTLDGFKYTYTIKWNNKTPFLR